MVCGLPEAARKEITALMAKADQDDLESAWEVALDPAWRRGCQRRFHGNPEVLLGDYAGAISRCSRTDVLRIAAALARTRRKGRR